MSDLATEQDQSTLLDKAELFYESEPDTESAESAESVDVPTDEDTTQVEADTEVLSGPETTKYEFDDESGAYSFQSNGKTVKVDASKLIDEYQLADGNRKKTEDLANQRKTMESQYSEKIEALTEQENHINAVADELTKVFLEQEKSIDWDELRETDISEYTKQRELQRQREDSLRNAMQTASDQRKKREQDLIKSELDKLSETMGWEDTTKQNADMKVMKDYFKKIGMPETALKGVYHHKVYQALHDAAKYEELKSSTEQEVKQVKTAPKSVKSQKTPKEPQKRSAWEVLYGA